jgi:hypothetical protein
MARARSLLAALAATATVAGAQAGPPPSRDTARVLPTVDSVFTALPLAEGAPRVGGSVRRWTRDELSQSGALSLAELLERIPGAAILRSGFILAPQVVTWFGDPDRVRVFLDGVELDALDARAGNVRDLGSIDIWMLEEVEVETTPGELRVHLRSWRVDRRVPETRLDVYTGDDETNLYRGFYGRRFASGLAAQFGFQQFGTTNRVTGGDGDALSLFGRLGWSAGVWSTDVAVYRDSRTRSAGLRVDEAVGVAAFTGGTTHLMARAAYRDPASGGRWAQLALQSGTWRDAAAVPEGTGAPSSELTTAEDSTVSRQQLVAAAGTSLYGVRVSTTARYRSVGADWYLSPAARLSWEGFGLGLSARHERQAEDSVARSDVALRYRLGSWLRLEGGVTNRSPMWTNPERASRTSQAMAFVTVRGWEVGVGQMQRPASRLLPPTVFGAVFDTVEVADRRAGLLWASVPVFGVVRLDAHATQWDAAGAYRPDLDLRVRLHGETEWRERFPRGDFTVRVALEYRRLGEVGAPVDGGLLPLDETAYWSSSLELRIRTATLSWQFRNITGSLYSTVPGYRMPQRVNLYGIRWYFGD